MPNRRKPSSAGEETRYGLDQADLQVDEAVRTRLMGLVKTGHLSVEAAIRALKGTEEDIATIFAWHDARRGFPTALFRTHDWIMPSSLLLQKFIEQYPFTLFALLMYIYMCMCV